MGLADLLVVTTILRSKLLLGNVFRLSVAALSITVFSTGIVEIVCNLTMSCTVSLSQLFCNLHTSNLFLRFALCNLEPGVISQYFLPCI